jgi:hypothetical protein
MFTTQSLHEKLRHLDDEEKTAFLKSHATELAGLLRQISDPASPKLAAARTAERAREDEWCSQNPDPAIEVGTLLWARRRGETVPITVTEVQRFPDGRRRYTVLKDGTGEDWPEWLLMRRYRPA